MRFPNFLFEQWENFAAAIVASPKTLVDQRTVEQRPVPKRAVGYTGHSLVAEEVPVVVPEEEPAGVDVVIVTEGPNLVEVAEQQTLNRLKGY
jgi:hypothetical protein